MALFVVKRAPRGQRKPIRVIISKGVVSGAVQRNLLKRRMRAVMRPVVGKSQSGFVIIVKPGAASLTYKELRERLLGEIRMKQ